MCLAHSRKLVWLEREGREAGHGVQGEPDQEGLAGQVRTLLFTLGEMGASGEF